MRLGRVAFAVSAATVAAALSVCGCGARGAGPRGTMAGHDSSFADVTFQRERAPMKISMESGKLLYAHYCAICHGESGGGDGFNAYNVKTTYGVTPTAFADSAAFSSVPAESAQAAIRNGGPAVGKSPAMPPWGQTLTHGEVIDVLDYVRSLGRAAEGK